MWIYFKYAFIRALNVAGPVSFYVFILYLFILSDLVLKASLFGEWSKITTGLAWATSVLISLCGMRGVVAWKRKHQSKIVSSYESSEAQKKREKEISFSLFEQSEFKKYFQNSSPRGPIAKKKKL